MGLAQDAIDPELGVAFDRVVRLHGFDHALHALHKIAKAKVDLHRLDAKFRRAARLSQELGRAQQGLGRYAAGIQAVAAHLVALDQRHLGLHRSSNVGRDQAGGTCPDHHQVVVELLRSPVTPFCIDLAPFEPGDDTFGQQRKRGQQCK